MYPSHYGSMASLIKFIFKALNSKLSDDVWKHAHASAYEYMLAFAQENPIPNIRSLCHPLPAPSCYCTCSLLTISLHFSNFVLFALSFFPTPDLSTPVATAFL
jgi:hypothetical protein